MSFDPRAVGTCPSASHNVKCFNIYDRNNSFPIDILYLNPGSPTCPSPLKILLVLLAYNLVAIAITFVSTLVRRISKIREWYGEVDEKPRDMYFPIPIGSLIIQILFTIGSGYVLHDEDPASDPAMLTILWFARPLATLLLLPLSFISQDPAEACELLLRDFVYHLIAFGGFCAGAHATILFGDFSLPPGSTLEGFNANYIPEVKAGAAIGILGFVGSFVLIVAHALGLVRHWLWTEWRHYWGLLLVCLMAPHILYTMASWLLWIGLVNATPQGFCPSDYALGKLAALWIFAAVFDNLWRGFALLLSIGDPDSCPRWITSLGELVYEGWGFSGRE